MRLIQVGMNSNGSLRIVWVKELAASDETTVLTSDEPPRVELMAAMADVRRLFLREMLGAPEEWIGENKAIKSVRIGYDPSLDERSFMLIAEVPLLDQTTGLQMQMKMTRESKIEGKAPLLVQALRVLLHEAQLFADGHRSQLDLLKPAVDAEPA